jgi:major membrane immunogen (membrane-anchored lipoprotein)
MKKLIFVLCASVLLAACGGGGPAGFSVKLKGADLPFEKKTMVAVMRPDIKETDFIVANYDVTLKDNSIRGVDKPNAAGQVMISFAVEGDGKDFKNPLQVGEYTNKQIKWVDVRTGEKGDSTPMSNDDYTFNGKIKITEITDDTVKGSMDITKGDSSVKGSFETKIVSKHL